MPGIRTREVDQTRDCLQVQKHDAGGEGKHERKQPPRERDNQHAARIAKAVPRAICSSKRAAERRSTLMRGQAVTRCSSLEPSCQNLSSLDV
jgi:hypothetical protein